MLNELVTIYRRDIDCLRTEVSLYPDDPSLWQDVTGCPNSGGNLVLHLCGNLRHFIGAKLGNTGYVRQREAEFFTRDLSRHELVDLIGRTRVEVIDTLVALTPAALAAPSLLPTGSGATVPTSLWLLHLATHLAYHLGQLDYHRRAATGDRATAGAVSVQALVSV